MLHRMSFLILDFLFTKNDFWHYVYAKLNDARSFLFIRINHRYTIIDCLLTQILRIDEEEFSLQNLSSDKPLPRLLASCKSI